MQVLARDPASAPTACRGRLDTKRVLLQLHTAEGGKACKAGDTMHLRYYRYNSYLIEQLCDMSKPVIRSGSEADPVHEVYLCTLTGKVMDPSRVGQYGLRVQF